MGDGRRVDGGGGVQHGPIRSGDDGAVGGALGAVVGGDREERGATGVGVAAAGGGGAAASGGGVEPDRGVVSAGKDHREAV